MSSLRTAVLVLSVVIARAEFEDLLLLQDPPPAPAPGPAPGPDMPDPLCPQFQGSVAADPSGASLPVCQDTYRACLNDNDCGELLMEFQNPANTVCSLDAAIGPCLASRNVSLDSPTFALGLNIAMCVICCNDGGYRPASFDDGTGQMIESECTCRLPAEDPDAPEAAECYIPFFWDGAWQTDCVEIGDADFCGGTLQPANMSQLLPCTPFDEADSEECTFPSVSQAGTTAPNPTDPSPVQGVGTLAVSSFVALLTVVGSLLLVD